MDLQTLNDTSGIWACLQLQNSSVLNGSLEVPNDTCGDALLLPKTEPARPKGEDLPTHTRHQNAAFVQDTRSPSLLGTKASHDPVLTLYGEAEASSNGLK